MPVLGTKLHVPVARRPLVVRDRLITEFVSLVRPRLVLVSAPAGFGKTTLLTQWLTGAADNSRSVVGDQGVDALRVAWLSLDHQDADLGRFLGNLVAAIGTSSPDAIAAVAPQLEATASAKALGEVEHLLVDLVNDLDTLAGEMVVALDDYHVIDDAEVHEAVAFLLENLPPRVSLAMTTRADPPLPLARLRARGELLEIRAADLRFTEAEATAFFNVMGLELEAEQVAALERRTEGWAAGLQLAAVSARALSANSSASGPGADVASFVNAFAGSHRFVLDYLVEEVLDRQPPDIRTFLLETSVLDELSADLCDALTERGDGQQVLERLERLNLFVVALDHDHQWWRYHHLFADALRSRLGAEDPSRAQGLRRRAASWYARQGRLREALGHALAGDDLEQAADLMELAVPGMRQRREDRQQREWLEGLPADVRSRRPLLASQSAWARLSVGDLDGVDRWLDAAEAAMAEQGFPLPAPEIVGLPASYGEALRLELDGLPAMVAIYRASAAQARGDLEAATEHARRAVRLAEPAHHFSRGSASAFLGLMAWSAGDLREAIDTFAEAVDSLRAAGNEADAFGSAVVLADMWLACGRPDEARAILEETLEAARTHLRHPLSTVGDVHVALADVLRELGDLHNAELHLAAAREIGDRGSLLEYRHRWYVAASGVARARGDLDEAVEMLETAESLFLPGFIPDVRPIPARRARVDIGRGHLVEARTWARVTGLSADVWTRGLSYLHEYEELTFARLRIAELDVVRKQGGGLVPGDADDVEAQQISHRLEAIVRSASAVARSGSVLDAHIVHSLLHRVRGDLGPAVQELAAALVLGVPVGMKQPFLDEGGPMGELLTAASTQAGREARVLAGKLLEAPDPTTVLGARSPTLAGPAPEPPGGALSDREIDVLRLLATDLSGPQIAEHLFVSVNTFRTHTKHIFTKLGVSTRRAAVRRALEMHLIHS